MDQYDPKKKLGLIVDEWGTWYNVEPGTNPGFLYQQNTMRDALVACLNLNIFNKYSDRVKMACIAQMVNVLQSVLLTEGPQMVKTPTWHVFDLFKEHQDAQLVESRIETEMIGEEEEWMVPNLSESASVSADGKLQLTLGNLSLTEAYPVRTQITGFNGKKVSGRILTGAMRDKNTFEAPDTVASREYDLAIKDGNLEFTIPACSVLHITLEE
jgi:alpha-N-arabinofuranosidase